MRAALAWSCPWEQPEQQQSEACRGERAYDIFSSRVVGSRTSLDDDLAQPSSAIDAKILRPRLKIRLQVAAIAIAIISTTPVEQAHPDHHVIRAALAQPRHATSTDGAKGERERSITAPEADDWVVVLKRPEDGRWVVSSPFGNGIWTLLFFVSHIAGQDDAGRLLAGQALAAVAHVCRDGRAGDVRAGWPRKKHEAVLWLWLWSLDMV
ncbi:hypothetical protein PG991_001992 [Apiospora marii]|uniref:Uncharacterized protein n=1 Tax=Apiospora marii TaxID=335849 RepID=A0ABR1SNL8_9PEZI